MTRVLIWNEFAHEKTEEAVKKLYPNGIHNAIAEFLKDLADTLKSSTRKHMPNLLTFQIPTNLCLWVGTKAASCSGAVAVITEETERFSTSSRVTKVTPRFTTKTFRRL